MPKFYRTLLEVEILSEEPYEYNSLANVAYDIRDGDCSGEVTVKKTEAVSKEKMKKLLEKQGSDPAFFGIE